MEREEMALQALLVLEDGFTMKGDCFSGQGEVFGEVVFNTAMTGYQEMITDPSYRGQILTFTYPIIGSCGITEYDMESDSPQVEGLLVKECCRRPRNQRAQDSLSNYLEEHGIMGVEGIDTRSLTLHLRRMGTMKGVLSTAEKTLKSFARNCWAAGNSIPGTWSMKFRTPSLSAGLTRKKAIMLWYMTTV